MNFHIKIALMIVIIAAISLIAAVILDHRQWARHQEVIKKWEADGKPQLYPIKPRFEWDGERWVQVEETK